MAENKPIYLLAEVDGQVKRIPYATLLLSGVQLGDVPEGPTSDPQEQSISWDENAIYTYYMNSWGKTPRTVAHWEEWDSTTRPVLLDKTQTISDIERQTALRNLGIDNASLTKTGLIQFTDDPNNTEGKVLTRRALIELIHSVINGDIT